MTDTMSEGIRELKEWTSSSKLLREIPLTVRRGLFLETVNLTCVDAVSEYIAVGTNLGVVYWYNRETHNMQRLRPENNSYKITCIKVVSSVDFMVAAGDESGTVTIFRVPKPIPDWISPISKTFKQSNNNCVERYTVAELHSAPITALEWSTNSQKLFSGDTTGLVVFTEMDFYMNLSKACEILNEKYRIVQLSFHQNDQSLVVATDYRCIVAHRQESGWRVVQVGQKERKSLSRVGATFFPHPDHPLKRLVFSSRPGYRFWLADNEGIVQKTIIFKDAVRKPLQQIRLIHQPPTRDISWDEDLGPVLAWCDRYLVSYNSTALVVMDPHNISVVASITGLSHLHSVCVTRSEIFIIFGSRSLARLAYEPDPKAGNTSEAGTSVLDLKVSPVADTLLELTSKIKSSAVKLVNSRANNSVIGYVEEDIVTGTEAMDFELPPVVPLDIQVEELTLHTDSRLQILEQIGKESFDNILHSSTRKKKNEIERTEINDGCMIRSVSGMESSTETLSSRLGETIDSEPNTRPSSRNNNQSLPSEVYRVETVYNTQIGSDKTELPHLDLDLVSSSRQPHGAIPPDILPDLRSPDSILKDVHDKEILVAKAFNLEEVLLADKKKACEGNQEREQSIGYGPPSGSSSAIPSLDTANNTAVQTIIKTLQVGRCVPEEKGIGHPLAQQSYDTPDQVKSGIPNSIEEYNDNWCQVTCPENVQHVSISTDFVCMSGPSRTLHTLPLVPLVPEWKRLQYRAVQLVLSPSGQVVWKVDFGVASALKGANFTVPEGTEWEVAAREVESVALSDTCAWYVSAGKVYLQTELSRSKPCRDGCLVPCPSLVIRICCSNNVVWVLTTDYWVLWRTGITDDCLEGTHWQRVNIPTPLHVADIALGPYDIGWIVDRSNAIYFSDNYITNDCSWWQVLIRNYLYETCTLSQISSNENSVWVTNRISPFVYKNASTIKGHNWVEVPTQNLKGSMQWRHVTAEGLFDEEKGTLWLLSSVNELFYLRPNSNNIEMIALPCKGEEVSSISAAPHALWLLTVTGHIYVRQGMCDQCPEGDNWRLLNLEQISDKHVTLRHVSCGCDIIWACDTNGEMYMAVGSPYLIATDMFSPAWVQVEGKPLPDTCFVKVFVGSQSHIVWALDNKHNVYVRSGIFHDFLLGTEWLVVSGVLASEVAISGSLVWVLANTGVVFCRFGISENNFIGNYWYQVPGTLSHLTASWFTNYHKPLSEGLWGIAEKGGTLLVYMQYSLGLTESSRRAILENSLDDSDWTII